MYKIINTKQIASQVKIFEIEAMAIARKWLPGQFVILRISDDGERIPITIAKTDSIKGTITIIVQGVGKTTMQLLSLDINDTILDIVGPLGNPTHIEIYGTCVVIGGGVGVAIAYPTASALKAAGNKVIVIIGGRSKDYILLQDEISMFADEVYVTTDDGSLGMPGVVTDKLNEILQVKKIDYVLAIGPVPMMHSVANATLPNEFHSTKIKTVVSLNTIMIDGTGMCGGCRATVYGKNVFVCVDGPEFDAHGVDFISLQNRNNAYKIQEHTSNCYFKDNQNL